MLDVESLATLRTEIRGCVRHDLPLLSQLRDDLRPLRATVRRIHPHSTTAISLVGTDGGNNQIRFDPLMVQLVRVVDSSNNEYCLEALTPSSNQELILGRHLNGDGKGRTAFGRMMEALSVRSLTELSTMIPSPISDPKPSWVNVYRELSEWAILLDLVRTRDFATDTLIIQDGYLRTKVFAGYLFRDYRALLHEAIDHQFRKNRRRIFVAGIAKRSKVLQTYQLAMALEGVLRTTYPAFVSVPTQMQERAWAWEEYARGDDEVSGGEGNRFVAGKMFFVKFGRSPYDPVWTVDLLDFQADHAPQTMGYMLNDAEIGFPVPYYPLCLQRAHENAALVDFDMTVLQDEIFAAFREGLGERAAIIEDFRLQADDPSANRYLNRGNNR